MMERVILHCDLNNFFASVELLSRPEWKQVPMAVCGSVEARHGVILAKNEPAKRYGVKTAETLWEARRKCPQLITVPPHPDQYRIFSRRAHRVYERFTDRMSPLGLTNAGWMSQGAYRFLALEKRLHTRSAARSRRSWGLRFLWVSASIRSLRSLGAISRSRMP